MRRTFQTTVMPIVDDRSEPTGVAVKGMLQLAHWAKTGLYKKEFLKHLIRSIIIRKDFYLFFFNLFYRPLYKILPWYH